MQIKLPSKSDIVFYALIAIILSYIFHVGNISSDIATFAMVILVGWFFITVL